MTIENQINQVRELLGSKRQGMTITEIASHLETNRSSALNILNLLQGSGEITMRTFGRAKVYSLSSKIPAARLMSLSSDLFLILDQDLYIEDCNDPFAEFFQINRDKVIGSNLEYTGIPTQFSVDIIEAARLASSGKKQTFEAYAGTESEDRFFKISCIPVQQGDFSTLIAIVMHDLTLYRAYQEELEEAVAARTADLRASEERFSVLTELAPVGIFETDAEGMYVYVNQKWCEITGLTQEKAFEDGWKAVLEPSERDWIALLWKEHIQEQIPWNMTFRIVNNSGVSIPVMVMAVPLRDPEGDFTGFLGTVIDIRDRVEAEEVLHGLISRLYSVLNMANDGIATFDGKWQFHSCNPAGCSILGYSEHELSGQSAAIVYPSGDDFERLVNKVDEELKRSGNYRGEQTIRKKDGTLRIVDISLSAFESSNNVLGRIAIFRDITERYQHEIEFRSVLDGLVDAVGVLTHDGFFLYANASARRYLAGDESAAIVGKNLSDFFSPEDTKVLLSYYQEVLNSGVPAARKFSITISGTVYEFQNRAVPITFGPEKNPAVLSMSLDASLWETGG